MDLQQIHIINNNQIQFRYLYQSLIKNQLMDSPKKQYKPFTIAVLSACASWLGDVIVFPLDTISVKLNAIKQQTHKLIPYTRHVLKTQGFKSLYRGVIATFGSTFLSTTIYLSLYEQLRIKISEGVDKYGASKSTKLLFPFLISTVAQLISLIVQLPCDTIKMRFQMNDPRYQYQSIFQGLKQVHKNQGVLRLYKSGKIFIVYISLWNGIQFQVYQILQFYGKHSFFNTLVYMNIGTITSCTICNPLELIVTRYALADTRVQKLQFKKMVKQIYQFEGFRGFYKGYVVRTLSGIGFNAFWLPIYAFAREKYGIELSD